ncbi:MAG: hypothetical protein QOI66_2350 [Myxococcales bacterium]|jgi:hypothetical protein|nr:hypothetical protein [Myxococcales bacterium]
MKIAVRAFSLLAFSACATLGCSGGNAIQGPTGGSGGTSAGASGGSAGGAGGTGGVGPSGTGGDGNNGGTGGQITPPPDGGEGGGDASTDSAANPDGAPDCAGLFCEDFEQGQIDPARWSTPSSGMATMMVQQKIVAHGKYAVQFHGPAAPPAIDYVYIISKGAPAALQKHNFGRAYFYIAPKKNDTDMGMIWGGTSGFPKPTYMSIANHSTGWQFGFIKLSGSPGGERQAYPPGDIPVATWTCLEWEFNDDPDEINVWGDGKMIGSLNNRNVAYPPGQAPGTPLFNNMNSGLIGAFTDFGFGFYDWHPQGRPAFDLYYDDIVLDTKRVGCLPP